MFYNLREISFSFKAILRVTYPVIGFTLILHGLGPVVSRLGAVEPDRWKVIESVWQYDFNGLQPGLYYISIGRPRAPCEIQTSTGVVDRNSSAFSFQRDSLLLGGTIHYKGGEMGPTLVELVCRDDKGFPHQLTGRPVVAHRSFGISLQLWRALTQVLLGPFFSFILLAYLVLVKISSYRVRGYQNSTERIWQTTGAIVFAAIAFFYSISLSHITRFWMEGANFTYLHTVLRSVFAIGYILLVSSYVALPRWLTVIHFIQLVGQIFVGLVSPESIVTYYKCSFFVFIFSSFFCAYLFLKERLTNSISPLAGLFISYAMLLPFDFMATFVWQTENLTPSLLVVLSIGLISLKINERNTGELAAVVAQHIASCFEGESKLEELMSKVALLTGKASQFSRVSAYVDGFVLGATERQGEFFVRVFENGYNKETSLDSAVQFATGRGHLMQKAISSRDVLLGQGKQDQAWYAIVPIGSLACINISDDSKTKVSDVTQRAEILRRVMPALARLEERLSDYAVKQCLGLEKLRARFGKTNFERKVGCIFFDVDRYSVYTEQYGEIFSSFVSEIYLPALVKKVTPWAVPEYMRGDEIYFVSVEDLLPAGVLIELATANALREAASFSLNEGRDLSVKNGFPPLTMKAGVAVGQASVICDSVKVRTSGQIINEAKRLMDTASEGQILFRVDPGNRNLTIDIEMSDEFVILQKKNLIYAREIIGIDTNPSRSTERKVMAGEA